ncbi:MAG: NAD-dependent epimerase [Chthonomonadales bacterium]|nr:NAD-dependent epimerase [Chthonomonadales bacterium]
MGSILVTGSAGFIGYHLCERLLARGEPVVGLDNLNDYYEVSLKEARLARLEGRPGFRFARLSLEDAAGMARLFEEEQPDRVVNLAAQVGVRYSLVNPAAYVSSNLTGFANVLEGCRRVGVRHLVYASSSSVYGASTRIPYSAHDSVDHPISLYAATKRANELMAHTYSHLYGLPTTGLRFFTVYGPWGRPDMAIFEFTRRILREEPIDLYNHGNMRRDFTYVDDVVEGLVRVLDRPALGEPAWSGERPDPATSAAPYRIYNIGNHDAVELLRFVRALEAALGVPARVNMAPMQPGDVLETCADVADLMRDTGFRPATPVEQGVRQFVGWFRDYYGI